MGNEQPTQEQIKEFWEWCGFVWVERRPVDSFSGTSIIRLGGYWTHALAEEFECWYKLPELDLNNLFKYAVPKTRKILNSQSEIDEIDTVKYPFHDWMKRWAYAIAIKDEDTALALFWAIWEVSHNATKGT